MASKFPQVNILVAIIVSQEQDAPLKDSNETRRNQSQIYSLFLKLVPFKGDCTLRLNSDANL